MEKHVRLFLQASLILVALGTSMQVNSQPKVVTEIPVNSTGFVTIGNLVYFTAGDQLWRTDGTADGTILLKNGFSGLSSFTGFAGAAYFINADNTELWSSDGTPSGTTRLHISDGTRSLRIVGQTNDDLFFQSHDAATGLELYRTDGTAAGTMLVKDINPGAGDGFAGFAAAAGNYLFFGGNDGTAGRELWKSDGTSGGTLMVKDINPGAADGFAHDVLVRGYNNLFYFGGVTPESGREPWVSDGTPGGTTMLQDMLPGSAAPGDLDFHFGHNGIIYFIALNVTNGNGAYQLWKSGGTTATTSMVKDVLEYPTYGEAYFYNFLAYNDKVYFFNHNPPADYLWVTDGTPEGTQTFFDLLMPEGSITYFDVVDSHLLFAGDQEGSPTPLYRSDGTAAGTEEFRRFNATVNFDVVKRIGVTTVGDLAFFADHDGPGEPPNDPEDYFHLFQTDGFTTQSMRTMYGGPTVGSDNITDLTGKAIFTTYDDNQDGGTGGPKRLWIYDPANPSETRSAFTLVNADTDEDIQTINEGDVITKAESSNVNVRYDPAETPGSVVFSVNGAKVRTENEAPYSLAGDRSGDYNAWSDANAGSYTLKATPYSEPGGQGTAGTPYTVSFTIEEERPPCTASGSILREYWAGVSGSRVSDIPLQRAPTSTSQLSIFEGPTNSGTNYGDRVNGYICPPATGNYTFWIASNDHSELWLSTDEDPSHKVRIAFIEGATSPRQWDKFVSQKSAPINLVTGHSYYIEALHKQGAGSDNLAVGWQLPDGTMERPIPESRLSPAEGRGNSVPEVTIFQPEDGATFKSPATVVIYADANDPDGSVTKVEFFADGGKIGEDYTKDETFGYKVIWENVPPGTHALTAEAIDNSGGIGVSDPVNITITGVACAANGFITRDYWANIPGSRVSDIPVDMPPTSTSEINFFEGPSNVGTNYASRIRGYICPPMTGNYTFWIASNDNSELWISTVENDPSSRQRIAFVEGATDPRQWNKYSSQRSAPIMLEQGKRYYIEALHKQGMGTDHIAVGWMLPNFSTERPIPGRHLSPFETNDGARMASADEATVQDQKSMYSQINLYPNPVQSSNDELRISGYEGIDQLIETQVEIISLTGEVIYQEQIRCGGDCSSYLININQQLVPGLYMVHMKTNGIRFSKRLLVK
jgi:ELWxxDGT repeat protein